MQRKGLFRSIQVQLNNEKSDDKCEYIGTLQLFLNMVVHWGSTYAMLLQAYILQKVLLYLDSQKLATYITEIFLVDRKSVV